MRLSQQDARRIAVQAQLLTADRPANLFEVLDRLTLLQLEPTKVVAPTHHLVLWSRLGRSYSRDELADALAAREVIEVQLHLRPAWFVALLRAEMAAWPGGGAGAGAGASSPPEWQIRIAEWLKTNDACRRDILHRLDAEGAQPAGALPDTCVVPWRSTGWTNDKNVQRMLDFMEQRGEIAVSHRAHGQRHWDLAERVYPDDPPVPAADARRQRDALRLHALGIARARATARQVEPDDIGEAGEPAVIEGVRGRWRVDAAYLDGLGDDTFRPRVALLSPLDRLVFDRKRMADLFDFDYKLEMYQPKATRRWGYWALPILVGDRLVGKVDATADREAGVLRVDAVHEDEPFDEPTAADVRGELTSLAGWLGLDLDERF